ncbi:cytochrome c-type biogenesis protein CcmF, partial [mine drainage metagenome]
VYALILALLLALAQSFFGLAGPAARRLRWMAVVRPAAFGQLFFMALSYGCLTYLFVISDYSVRYVARYSNPLMPFFYRVAGVWGAHEGSMMLWLLVLGIWTALVALFSRKLPVEFSSRVLGVLGVVSSGFFLFTLLTSNPFVRMLPPALHGGTLNPILEDPLLVIHPPMLYMGYVGLSVAFAFSVAALISGRMDAAWARWTRPWTLAAWYFSHESGSFSEVSGPIMS